MPVKPDFGTFRKGKPASARAMTAHADRLRELTPLRGGFGVNVSTTQSGTVVAEERGTRLNMPVVLFKTTAARSQLCTYDAKSIRGIPYVEQTADLTIADIGTLSPVDDLIVWSLNDIISGGQSLAPDQPGIGIPLRTRSADGKLVVLLIAAVGGGGLLPFYEGTVLEAVTDGVAGADYPFSGNPR